MRLVIIICRLVKLALACFFSFALLPGELLAQNGQNYVVEPNHSTIGFSMPIAGGITQVSGKFTQFLITMDYVDEDLTKSSFRAEILVGSIDTGIERRDNHLRSETFFEADKFPEIVFETSRIEREGDEYIAIGNLTMHGITKEIPIPFIYKGAVERYHAFEAKSSLLRSDYGVGSGYQHPGFENFLSDRVDFTFSFWAMGPIPDDMFDKVKQQLKGNE